MNRIPGVSRTYRKPSVSSARMGRGRGRATNAGSHMASSDPITATKLSAFSPKQAAAPRRSMAKPATAGPSNLLRLSMVELKATALATSCLSSTSSSTSDCRAGTSKALIMAHTASCLFLNTASASRVACAIDSTCVASSTR